MKTGRKAAVHIAGTAAAGKRHHIQATGILPGIGTMTAMVINGIVVTGIVKKSLRLVI